MKLPITISVGEYYEIIKRDHTERMANAIPGARLVIQHGVSHFAMLQNPAQFNEAITENPLRTRIGNNSPSALTHGAISTACDIKTILNRRP